MALAALKESKEMKWKVIVGILIILVSLGLFREIKEVKRLNERIGILTNNNKAYELELLNFSNERISYKMTIAEINKSKDKVIEELNKTRKELGIKDRELNQALCFKTSIIDTIKVIIEYNDTSYIKKDSIVFYGVCDFDKEIAFNALTKLNVSLRGEELTTELNVSDRIKLFDYSRRE